MKTNPSLDVVLSTTPTQERSIFKSVAIVSLQHEYAQSEAKLVMSILLGICSSNAYKTEYLKQRFSLYQLTQFGSSKYFASCSPPFSPKDQKIKN